MNNIQINKENTMPRGRPRKVVSELSIEDLNENFNTLIKPEKLVEKENIPLMSDPEWNDYVLSLLTEDEFDERIAGIKLPKTDGLARVARKLFGNIQGVARVFTASPEFCVVEYNVSTEGSEHESFHSFTAVADATSENTDPPYNRFLVGVASTRAKGRAYRDLLGLKNVVVAEELSEKAESDVMITSAQKAAIKNLCNQLNINLIKYINMDGDTYTKLDEINKNNAIRLLAKLNDYKHGKEEVRVDILNGEKI